MPADDDTIEPLREALEVTPENVKLRIHVARLLEQAGRLAEAEAEYREALSRAPDDEEIKLALAEVFGRQAKGSEALVLLESLIQSTDASARVYMAYARTLFRLGEIERAVRAYHRAIEADPDAADPALAVALGIFDDDEENRSEVVDGRVRSQQGDGIAGEPGPVPLERPDCSFTDVGGMDDLKEEISLKIIAPLAHPELYEAYGKKIGGGILLYGPPGCGKTHLARATAGEVEATFLAVGIDDVLDMWIGESERKLHELFEHARRNRPCVLFFDEVDALGASRSDMRRSAGRQLINQFLAELDGVKSSNEGLLILGATNAPWHLDGAFRRPGRFDRVIFVPPPDESARASILEILLDGKPCEEVDVATVAKKTAELTGADLKAIVDTAIEEKLRRAIRDKKASPLRTADLLAAAKKHKPTAKEWFATARNYALYSNEGGLYDDIVSYLKLR